MAATRPTHDRPGMTSLNDSGSDASVFAQAVERISDGRTTAVDEAIRLVEAMSLDEKLGCLDGDLEAWPGLFAMMFGSYHRRTFPAAAVPRLGIPGIEFSDGPRGCVIGEKTAFPVSMARGASWDPVLEERIGDAIGAELRSVGATFYGGVCVNVLRHPGWGRAQETYGEDPYLVGEMGRALTLGAQRWVMACVKHFAVNSIENARFKVDVIADDRALHEVYLPHFRRIVEAGVASVMSAYNSLNGTFCGDNEALLTGILRDEWGFDGFVISDFIFGLRDAVRSVVAGLDIEMPFRQQRAMHLPAAVSNGTLPIEIIDRSVVRTVATLLRFAPVLARAGDASVVLGPQHRSLAREAATASIVMLRNEGVLPLDPTTLKRVAMVGRLAAVRNLGDRGSSEVIVSDAVTPLDGLRAALAPYGVEVVHTDRDASLGEDADAVVVVVGFTHADEGEFIDAAGTAALQTQVFPPMSDKDRVEIAKIAPPKPADAEGSTSTATQEQAAFAPGGDRRTLQLSSDDTALISAAVAANPRTIVVVMGGSATMMESWRLAVPGILLLWYPGIEGGHALADVLLGVANPSGHLPFTIPTDEAHLPHFDPDAATETYDLWHGYWKLHRDGNVPAYPFGFGLSYTEFSIDAAVLSRHDDAARVTVTVTNCGQRDGAMVVQVYAGLPDSVHERPALRLIGFARVTVQAGGTVTTDVPLDIRQLHLRLGDQWVQEGGDYRFIVGQHSSDSSGIEIIHALPAEVSPARSAAR